jgi:hypothetical protein
MPSLGVVEGGASYMPFFILKSYVRFMRIGLLVISTSWVEKQKEPNAQRPTPKQRQRAAPPVSG